MISADVAGRGRFDAAATMVQERDAQTAEMLDLSHVSSSEYVGLAPAGW